MKDLRTMTSKELKEIAKEMKISNWWNLKKEVLIQKIEEAQNMSDEEKQAIADQRAKEDATLDEYKKNWRHYTKTYNPVEFMEKWRSGEITLGDEEETETTEAVEEETAVEEQPANTLVETPAPEKPVEGIKKPNLKIKEITYKGETKSIREWAEQLEMPWPTLYDRINRNGWSVEEAIEIPLGGRRKK